MVSRPTWTAVSASISTPVRPSVSTVASQCTAEAASSRRKSTATRVIGSGWHSGTRSAVRLAPWIAAMRAMPITSPFFASPRAISASVSGCMRIVPVAVATRCVGFLAETSTMWAWPWASKWVSGEFIAGGRQSVEVEDGCVRQPAPLSGPVPQQGDTRRRQGGGMIRSLAPGR